MNSKGLLSTILILYLADSYLARPSSITDDLWCTTCQAVVRAMVNKLGHRRKEYEILDHWDDVCHKDNFAGFNYHSSQIVQACHYFIEDFDDEVIEGLKNRKNNEVVEAEVCFISTGVCNFSAESLKNQESRNNVDTNSGEWKKVASGKESLITDL